MLTNEYKIKYFQIVQKRLNVNIKLNFMEYILEYIWKEKKYINYFVKCEKYDRRKISNFFPENQILKLNVNLTNFQFVINL